MKPEIPLWRREASCISTFVWIIIIKPKIISFRLNAHRNIKKVYPRTRACLNCAFFFSHRARCTAYSHWKIRKIIIKSCALVLYFQNASMCAVLRRRRRHAGYAFFFSWTKCSSTYAPCVWVCWCVRSAIV